jgi:hypothetical protein
VILPISIPWWISLGTRCLGQAAALEDAVDLGLFLRIAHVAEPPRFFGRRQRPPPGGLLAFSKKIAAVSEISTARVYSASSIARSHAVSKFGSVVLYS